MGTHSSKSVSTVTNDMSTAIISGCVQTDTYYQGAFYNIKLEKGCDNAHLNLGNNGNYVQNCSNTTSLDAVQKALASSNSSVTDGMVAAFNKETSNAYSATKQSLATDIQSFCTASKNANQTLTLSFDCVGKNDIIDAMNTMNADSVCLLATTVRLAQEAAANATSSTKSGLTTGEIIAICVGIAVVLLAAGVGYYMYRRGKGIREAKAPKAPKAEAGGGGTAAPTAPVTSSPETSARTPPVVITNNNGPAAPAGGRFGSYGGHYGGRYGNNNGLAKYGSRCDWEW